MIPQLYHHAGTPNTHYSLLTDNEHSLNAQFIERGQRLNEVTDVWEMLPTLDGRATVVGAVGLRFKDDTAQVLRVTSGLVVGKLPLAGKSI